MAFCVGWLGTNFYYVAWYLSDARAMAIPLLSVGGGEVYHDWNYMLSTLGLLQLDTTIAFGLRGVAVLCMLFSLVSMGWIMWQMATATEVGRSGSSS